MKILSADIGGTNSRFAAFQAGREGELSLLETVWLKTEESSSFSHLIEMLRESGFSLKPEDADIAVIAVAGPVERGVYSSPPFISWDIDLSVAKEDIGFRRSLLINDFVAQAFASRSPIGESAEEILSGEVDLESTVAVIGAGTALGKAALVPDGTGGYIAIPSEGGHANFPFVSIRESEFQEFLMQELGEEYITANHVVSGRGLSYIHQFLTGEALEPHDVAERFPDNPETLFWCAGFYGRICRNYALETLALGGLYIAGGVAARIPELVRHIAFETEFRNSGRLEALLEKIPVFLINNEESGLWGAAVSGLQRLKRESQTI